jgi:hypothetical protein
MNFSRDCDLPLFFLASIFFFQYSSKTAQKAWFSLFLHSEHLDMPKPLPQAKRDAIRARIEEGVPHIDIAEEMNVSIQTVKNYSANLKHYGTVLLPSISLMGRPATFTREMIEVCCSKEESGTVFRFWQC